jgi:hypothetical protein
LIERGWCGRRRMRRSVGSSSSRPATRLPSCRATYGELVAHDASPLTCRSYAFDLLRWWRFLAGRDGPSDACWSRRGPRVRVIAVHECQSCSPPPRASTATRWRFDATTILIGTVHVGGRLPCCRTEASRSRTAPGTTSGGTSWTRRPPTAISMPFCTSDLRPWALRSPTPRFASAVGTRPRAASIQVLRLRLSPSSSPQFVRATWPLSTVRVDGGRLGWRAVACPRAASVGVLNRSP